MKISLIKRKLNSGKISFTLKYYEGDIILPDGKRKQKQKKEI